MSHDDERPEEHNRWSEGVKRSMHDAVEPEPDHRSRERNSGVAIALLAGAVVLILLAIVSGATDAFRP